MTTAKIKQSPKRPADERRRELMQAATRLFSKKGYRSTTTEEIARAAGLTKGALYHHFKSKEDVLYELIQMHMDHYQSEVLGRLGDEPTVMDLIDVHLDLKCGGDQAQYQAMVDIWVQAWKIPRMKRLMNKRVHAYVDDLVSRVKSPRGISKKRLFDLVVTVLSLRDGLSVVAIIAPSLIDIDAQRKILISMFNQSVS